MGSITQTIIQVFGIIAWFSMYLFMEFKFEKMRVLKKKPIIRALILFVYMYIGITFINTII